MGASELAWTDVILETSARKAGGRHTAMLSCSGTRSGLKTLEGTSNGLDILRNKLSVSWKAKIHLTRFGELVRQGTYLLRGSGGALKSKFREMEERNVKQGNIKQGT